MRRTYKYKVKLKQNAKQKAEEQLGLACSLYNACIEQRRTAWERCGESVNGIDQKNELPKLKKDEDFSDYKKIGSQVLQDVIERTDLAYQHFFRRVKTGEAPGYPRYKSYKRYQSITFKQAGWKYLHGGRLKLQGIGVIKFFESRELPGGSRVKTVTLKRDQCGDWFICFSLDNVQLEPLPKTGKQISLDLGLKKFFTDNNGKNLDNPRFLQKNLRNLKLEQRKLSKKKSRGQLNKQGVPSEGKNREKQRIKVAKLHRKIARCREDFHFKTAHYLVSNYDRIVIEDLDVQRMIENGENKGLNKSIYDVGWGQFVQILLFKAEEAGKEVVQVDPKNTTQMCSNCGCLPKVKKTLKDRTHLCEDCGFTLDRDHNAALNILVKSEGINQQELEEVKYEGGEWLRSHPLASISAVQVDIKTQESPVL